MGPASLSAAPASEVVWVTEDPSGSGARSAKGTEAVRRSLSVSELAATFDVREVAYDPWHLRAPAIELAQSGLQVVEFPQSNARMVLASQRLHATVVEGRLARPRGPQLNAHVAAAVAQGIRSSWPP